MRIARTAAHVLLAVLGGYALSAALSAGVALLLSRTLGLPRAEAVVLASLLGFVLYLALLLWALSVRGSRGVSAPRASSFRKSMSLVHTWAGVVLGGVLFAVFWMGTLSVFDREIDQWMMPATRLGPPPREVSLEATARKAIEQLAPGVEQWSVSMPSERAPTLKLRYPGAAGASVSRHLDPRTGAVLETPDTLGGTGFIFPFHFSLHLRWLDLGLWIVGLSGMALLALVASGVVIHVHLLKEFFTFRPRKALTRSSLDLHTTMGVLLLPFHIVMPLSGLVIFFSVFFPGTWQAAYSGDRAAFLREVFGSYQRPKADRPAALGSLDAMLGSAEQIWGAGEVSSVRVRHAGDAASHVEMRRSSARGVTLRRDQIHFDGATGALLERFENKRPAATVQSFLAGIHFTLFEHWTLRWLYFGAGLAGCVMIATGFVFWLESRRARHTSQGLWGVRVVEALTVGSVSGIVLATFAFFVANRGVPAGANLAGLERHELEMAAFYAVWVATFVHAAARGRRAWAGQCWGIAALGVAAVALNWVTTGDHLARSIERGLWSVAGMDLVLLAAAAAALATALRLTSPSPLPSSTARALHGRAPSPGGAGTAAHG